MHTKLSTVHVVQSSEIMQNTHIYTWI